MKPLSKPFRKTVVKTVKETDINTIKETIHLYVLAVRTLVVTAVGYVQYVCIITYVN